MLTPVRSEIPARPARLDLDTFRRDHAPEIVGTSGKLMAALDVARRVADTDCTILVTGETGTGKELLAEAIHRASRRRSGPFIALNCAALPETLIEAELFGHVKGAFTGATGSRKGRVLAAEGGTLFLDEVGELPLTAQAKLLRVLQAREVLPVGADESCKVDVRILAATHRDLAAMVREGKFRADLYYRLVVIQAHLPALRERGEDIVTLAEHFLVLADARHGRTTPGISAAGRAALRNHAWPGNVRELSNAIERAVLLGEGDTLGPADLGFEEQWGAGVPHIVEGDDTLRLREAVGDLERRLIEQALHRAGGNRTEAAALLGLNRTTLIEKLRRIGGVVEAA